MIAGSFAFQESASEAASGSHGESTPPEGTRREDRKCVPRDRDMEMTSLDENSHFCTLGFGDLDLICLTNKGPPSICVSRCPWVPSVPRAGRGRAFLSPTHPLPFIIV